MLAAVRSVFFANSRSAPGVISTPFFVPAQTMKREFPKNFVLSLLIALMSLSIVPQRGFADEASDEFNLGVGLFRKQRWDLAAETFGQFLKDNAEHPRASLARLYYGLSLNSLEKYELARPQFETFIADNPTSPNLADARYRLGESSFYLQQYPVAIAQLSEYLDKHAGHNLNNWARLMLGNSFNAENQWAKSEPILQALVDSKPEAQILPDASFALARAMEGLNRPTEAIDYYNKVVELNAGLLSARALARTGTIYFDAKDFVRATTAYDAIVAGFSDQSIAASAALQAGIAQFQLRNYEQAVQRIDKVPADSPLASQSLMLKGLCLRELGQLDTARKMLADAYREAGDTPIAAEILFKRGQIEQMDRKKDVAAQMFLDLADRWPQDKHVAESLFNAAELKMELRDLEGSRQTLKRLVTDFPESASDVRVSILEGRILLADRKAEGAITVLTAALQKEGISERDRLLCSYHLIRSSHMAKKFEQVLAVFEPLEDAYSEPENSDFYGAIALAAMSSLELKQYDKSQQYSEQFLKLETDPNSVADGLAAHAVASAHLKQFVAAKIDLKRLAADFNENPQTWLAALQCAETAWDAEDFLAAAEFFELAATRKDDARIHEPALTGAAWCRYRLGQFEQSAEMFEQAAKAYGNSIAINEINYMAAMSRFEQGRLAEAESLFRLVFDKLEKEVTNDPNHPDAEYAFDSGRMYARLVAKNAEAANDVWKRLTTVFADSSSLDSLLEEWAFFNLGNGNYEQSDAIYKRLLDKFPNSKYAGQARLSLAESDMLANRMDEALKEFEAISSGPEFRDQEKESSLYHIVDILAARRQWPQVLVNARRFAELYSESPRAARVQLLLAEALLDQKQFAEAKQALGLLRSAVMENRLAADPWTERIWVVLADVALAEKRYSDIDVLADELSQRVPDSKSLFQIKLVQGLRWKSQAEPDLSRARELFKQVTQDENGRGTETAARSQFLIAETFLLENDLKSALKEYYRVYLSYPFDEWRSLALFQAAGCEANLGDKSAAIKGYEDFLKEFPKSSMVDSAKEKLTVLRP